MSESVRVWEWDRETGDVQFPGWQSENFPNFLFWVVTRWQVTTLRMRTRTSSLRGETEENKRLRLRPRRETREDQYRDPTGVITPPPAQWRLETSKNFSNITSQSGREEERRDTYWYIYTRVRDIAIFPVKPKDYLGWTHRGIKQRQVVC